MLTEIGVVKLANWSEEMKSIRPQESVAIAEFIKERDFHVSEVKRIQNFIYEYLKNKARVGEISERIMKNRFLTAPQTKVDAAAELVNAIAAAVATETKSYDALWKLVKNLSSNWRNLSFNIVVSCLERYLLDSLYFIYGMIERKMIDICPVFRFLKRKGLDSLDRLIAFYYFGPELIDYRGEWYQSEWNELHAMEHPPMPEFAADLGTVDWESHKTQRKSGTSENPILSAIRNDDSDALQKLIGLDKYRDNIPYSMYDQYLKREITIIKGDDSETLQIAPMPIISAIGLFGASKCFKLFVINHPEAVDALPSAEYHLVAGGSNEIVHYMDDNNIKFTDAALSAAIKFHHDDLIEWLLSDRVVPTSSHIFQSIHYANMHAMTLCMRKELNITHTNRSLHTIFHACAAVNAIEAFKYMLAEEPVSVNPYAKTSAGHTFLHIAARVGSQEIIKFWCRNWGNAGLNALDNCNLNPVHHAFIYAVYPRPSKPKPGLDISKPLYSYLLKRSNANYNLATDKNCDV